MTPDRMQERFEQALAEAEEVLFLCSGNIVRSAFAELYARHLDLPLSVRSAATTYVNDRIYPTTAAALSARGVDPDLIEAFRPTTLGDAARGVGARTLALAMTREHAMAASALRPIAPPAFLLARAAGRDEEIPDPMFTGAFEEAFERVAFFVEALVERLRAGQRRR